MYLRKNITHDEADKIINSDRKNWKWICENNYGTCYWNNVTGELIWKDDETDIARYNYKKE